MDPFVDPPALPEDPPGQLLPGQFNTGFGITSHPDITQDLKVAQSVATALTGKIREHIGQTVADAAVLHDDLSANIQEPIRQTLGRAALTLQALHQPILGEIAGQLGAAMEGVAHLGIVPPVPGQSDLMPGIVQIRKSALAGDLTPAFDAYRLTALPFENYGGLQFSQAVQAIQDALPDDPAIRSRFAAGAALLSQQQTLQPGMSLQDFGPAGPSPPRSMPPIPGQPGGGDVTDCAAERALQLQQALAQCAVTYNGNPMLIAECQFQVQQQFLSMAPCVGPGGGGGIPGVPSGPGGSTGGPVGGIRFPGRPGESGVCPPGTVPGNNFTECVPLLPNPGIAIPIPGGGVVPPGINDPGWGGGGGVNFGPGSPSGPPSLPPPPGGNPGSGCKSPDGTVYSATDISLLLSQLITNYGNISQAATAFTSQTGIQCYPNISQAACDSGYQSFVGNIAGSPTPFMFCVRCLPGSVPPPADGKCCPPPIINVNCGSAVTAPVVPPGDNQQAPAPKPIPAIPGVVNQPVPGCDEFGKAPGIPLVGGVASISQLAGFRLPDGTLNVPQVDFDPAGIVNAALKSVVGFFVGILDQLAGISDAVLKQSGCASGEQIALAMTAAVFGFMEKFTGDVFQGVTVPNRQQRNYLCPTALPSTAESAQAWLANTIDEKTLECWVRAAGQRYPEFKKYVDANRQKFSLLQIGSLYLRNKLTPQELSDRVRELGMTAGNEVAELQELLKVIPPPTDLVRFMVRDTADAKLVARFDMDNSFPDKFAGDIKDWAKQSGVNEEYMQHVWRAHWSIPSPGQLFDMLHRSAELNQADPAYVTQDDVETALRQQDILPYWIPKLLETAYHVLGRIDLRRGYQLGVLDFDALRKKYEVAGYHPNDAFTLAQVTEATTTATFKRSPIVNQFSNGWLTEEEFEQELSGDGATPEMISACRKRAIIVASSKMRKRCTDAYRKRFLIGDLDRADAQSNLVGLGLPADMVGTILAGWDCEKSANGKALPAGELANLYDQGAIDAPGLVQRLRRLGYAYEDAVLLGRRIATTTQQKITKRESDAVRKQEQEDYTQAKRQNQAIRQAQAAQDKAARRITSIQRVTRLRESRLLESGRNFSTHSGLSLSDATATVRGVYNGVMQTGLYLPDEAIAALVTAARDKETTTADQLSAVVRSILADVANP